jgi:benzoate-CoA ligase family protein
LSAPDVTELWIDRPVAAGRGGEVAYRHAGGVLTRGALRELALRAARALQEQGIRAGERVLLACLDAPEFLGAFWGALKLGAVPVPVSTLLRRADYAYLLKDSGARGVVVSAPLLDEIGPALRQGPERSVLVAGGAERSFEGALDRAQRPYEPPASHAEARFWLYSSGSTGAPKGVVHRASDMLACAEGFARGVLQLHADDRLFSAAKLFFAYGLGNTGYFPLAVEAQAVLRAERPVPEEVFSVLARERATVFFGVPTLYAAMLAVPDAARRFDLAALRLCVSAGEALPAEIFQRWQDRFGVEIVDGLGTTEALHVFLANRPGACRPGSSGSPVPGYRAELVDEEGKPVPAGEVGNLRVRGGSLMAEYWNQPERTAAALRDGWLATGDKYRQDESGAYWFCGRGDDMLKVGGIWVSPFEVESALVAHAAVLEAAVVGREDEARLTKPAAFVVLKEPGAGTPKLAAELQGFVKERLAPYKYPRWIEFVAELPKTATGKIQRYKLRAP